MPERLFSEVPTARWKDNDSVRVPTSRIVSLEDRLIRGRVAGSLRSTGEYAG